MRGIKSEHGEGIVNVLQNMLAAATLTDRHVFLLVAHSLDFEEEKEN